MNLQQNIKHYQFIPPNILIDSFTYRPKQQTFKPVYFLTHWHADHYRGITKNWNYGQIYCSLITKKLLLTQFPKLDTMVKELQLNVWYHYNGKILQPDQTKNEKQNDINKNFSSLHKTSSNVQFITASEIQANYKIMLIDSNHMAGSVMIFIKTPSKNYFHTGDMRYHSKIAKNCSEIFRIGSSNQYQCIFHVDQLFLDNTFCDPIFKFPPRSKGIKDICQIIQKHRKNVLPNNLSKKVYIITDSVGKEEVFLLLTKKYLTSIAVNSSRYKYCQAMGIIKDLYINTDGEIIKNIITDFDKTWLGVIRKGQLELYSQKYSNSIGILLTGWANIQQYQIIDQNQYLVPYSLHSNFQQIEQLVKTLKPKKIIPIVKQNDSKSTKFRNNIKTFQSYFYSLYFLKQRGLEFLKKQYCSMEIQEEDEIDGRLKENQQSFMIE